VDGDGATGTWTYLSPAVHDGQAIWIAGRWHNTFARTDGDWRIAHNACEPIFIAPYTAGWAAVSARRPAPARRGP
jgi:hypothetical protein